MKCLSLLTPIAALVLAASPVLAWDITMHVAPDNTRTIAASPNTQEAVSGVVTVPCDGDGFFVVRMASSITMAQTGEIELLSEELRATFFSGTTNLGTVWLPVDQVEGPLFKGFRRRSVMDHGRQELDCKEFGEEADSVHFVALDTVMNMSSGATPVVMGLNVETSKHGGE